MTNEGLEDCLERLEYPRNTGIEVIKLLDYRARVGEIPPLNGVFTIVNDASKSKPWPTFEQLMNSIMSIHKNNEKFETNFIKNKKRDKFLIKHSAKEVEYDIKTFIVKNVDEISASLEFFVQAQSNPLITNIFL